MKVKSILCGLLCLCLLSGCSRQLEQVPLNTSEATATEDANQLSYEEREAVSVIGFIRSQYNESRRIQLKEVYYYYMDDSSYEFVISNSDVDSPLKIIVTYSTDSQSEVMAIVVHRKSGYSFQLRSDIDDESITKMVYNTHIADGIPLDVNKIENAVEATNK